MAQIEWLKPHYVSPEGHLLMAVQAVLVEAPGLKLLVDTCIGNDKPRRLTRGISLETGFLQRLQSHGLEQGGCDRRGEHSSARRSHRLEHACWKTSRWVPTFPRARYLMARREYEFWVQDQRG